VIGIDMMETAYLPERGMSGRLMRTYDISIDVVPTRIDVRVFGDEAES
jgi:hypothetical protein